MRFDTLRPLGLAVLLAISTGCGEDDGLDRRALSGLVTFGDRPLDDGSILFDPVSGGAGTAVGSTIRQGRFEIARARGAVPGKYLVRIYASSGVQSPRPKGAPARKPMPMAELIPDVYNIRTTLEAIVKQDGPNSFRFDLIGEDKASSPAAMPP